jgi:type I restriction enzyme S subunit
MRRYDSYKDSDVEWIGEIPSGWEVSKYKYFISILSGYPFKSELFDLTEGFPLIRIRDITSGNTETYYNGEINETYVVRKGDLIIGMDGDFNTRWWCSNDGLLNQRCCSIKESSIVLRRFLHYILPIELKIINDLTYYTTVKHLSTDNLYNTTTILPPLSEQQQIVSYLDKKTSLIDTLIENTQKKIELLKEKRTSLISEVVTKGLNPNVEMKDSGVEWIGEIPSGWELRKGSTIGNYSKGNGIKKDEVKEVGLPCIRYGEIYTKYNHKFDNVQTYIEEGVTEVKVSSGTLFMTGSGELLEDIGKCVVYMGEEELYVGGDIIILKPFSEFDSEFLSYQINSECIRIQRELNGRGGIIVHIYSKNFKDMWFPTPPLSEQLQIVSYLDEQTQLIDKTISVEERRIELLKEYRQSLISEVVTGKRKVTKDE